jgi:hypothetical protein
MKALRFVGLLLFLPATLVAQSTSLVDRLPSNTSAYVLWRGKPALETARLTNSLLRLWDDPEFAPLRQAITAQFFAGVMKRAEKQSLTRQEMEDLLSLFENPGVLGFVGTPDLAAVSSAEPSGARALARPGFFAIYDTTGKAALHRKLMDRLREQEPEKPVLTTYEFAGTTVETAVRAKETSYRAYSGNFFILSNRKEVLEELIRRMQAADAKPDGILQNAAFQLAHTFTADGAVVEFFAQLPDLSKLSFPPQRGVDLSALMAALHAERLHALAGSLSLVGERTRLRLAALGDASPGSLFDLAAESSPNFATLAAAPAGASYSAWRMDLAALYSTLRSALKAGLPAQQSGYIESLEGSLNARLGMSVTDVLNLFGGEFAVIGAEAGFASESLPALFAATIRRQADVLRLLEIVFAASITSEEREGDTTYLAFLAPYTDPRTGAQRKRFTYVAVAPQMLFVGQRKTLLRQALTRLSSAAPAAGSLGADARFMSGRAELPVKLTSLSYVDLARFPWEKISEAPLRGTPKSNPQSPSADSPAMDYKALADVLSRYLHTMVGGWWKDHNGLFGEVYVQ